MRAAAGKNSIAALKLNLKEFLKICRSVSQTANGRSGNIAVAAFCYVLDRRGIPWALEVKRCGVSVGDIDVVLWPEEAYETYIELKWSSREREKQIKSDYTHYIGESAYFVTHGRDLTQSKVDTLAKVNVKSIPLEDTRGLKNIYTIDQLLGEGNKAGRKQTA